MYEEFTEAQEVAVYKIAKGNDVPVADVVDTMYTVLGCDAVAVIVGKLHYCIEADGYTHT